MLARAIVGSLLLSTAAILAVIFLLGDPSDLRELRRVSLPTLSVAVLLLLASFLAGGARLKVMLAMAGHRRLNIWRATRAFILGLFGAAVTPSGGGNGPVIILSLVRDRVETAIAWSVTVYSSVADLLFFGWAIPASALTLYLGGFLSVRLLWLAALLGVLSLALWYLLAFQQARLVPVVGWLFSHRRLSRWREPALAGIASVEKATRTVNQAHAGMHLLLQVLTVAMHLLLYSIFHAFATSLGADLGFLLSQAILVLVSVTSYVIPTPGASGYLELALSYGFSGRVPISLLTATVVAYRALTYYAPVLLGAVLGGTVLSKEVARRSVVGPANGKARQ